MSKLIRTVCCAVLALGLAAAAQAESLKSQLGNASQTVGLRGGNAFDALANVIADTAARNLPVISASAGITYRYNPELEVFERSSKTLGPIFMERPDTLGRNKFNVNVSFQYVQFDSYDGEDLDNLRDPNPIVTRVVDAGGNLLGFTANSLKYKLGIQNYITAFSFTYGILDDLDVNLLLPIIATTSKVRVQTQQLFVAPPDGAFTPLTGALLTGPPVDGSKTGVGDILLRFKYRVPLDGPVAISPGLQMRMPSGNEDNFQGVGAFEISPAVYIGGVIMDRVSTYGNLAIDVNTQDVDQSQARYSVGADVDILPRWGAAIAFLGRSAFSASASPSETSFLHLVGNRVQQAPLLGLDFDRKDYFDFSFGTRVVVWREIMLFANGIVALNDQGLRNDTVIPTFGVEGTF